MKTPTTTATARPTIVPFHRPYLDLEDKRALRNVLATGWLTTGKEAQAFEDEFGRYVNAHSCLALSSCTAALHLALELLGVRGKVVLVPTLTFTATAAAVIMAGGRPVLTDVDPDTLSMTARQCELAWKTAGVPEPLGAVMPMHYGGNPSGFRSTRAWVRSQKRVRLIDDAAHALPATIDGESVGGVNLGSDASCFSFYPTKPITTGEGGMLTLADAELLPRARRLSLHGIDADAYQRSRGGLYHYTVTEHGWKYNLPDVLAALGRQQLYKADTFWSRRTSVAEGYNKRFALLVDKGWLQLPMVEDGCRSSWHLYAIQLNVDRFASGWTRDRVAERLRALGVGSSMHYVPLHRQPYWEPLSGGLGRFPNAERAYARLLSLPIWVGLAAPQLDLVGDALEQVLREAQR